MRNVVYRWAPEDPRPEAERRMALFDFVYQTYDSSAWIPQSLFDGNLSPRQSSATSTRSCATRSGSSCGARNRACPRSAWRRISRPDSRSSGRSTASCATPRISTASTYFGAGTKVFDDNWLGDALKVLTSEPLAAAARCAAPSTLAYAADANRILNSHHHDKIDSLTRGRSTAFAASHVELYMRPHGGAMPA